MFENRYTITATMTVTAKSMSEAIKMADDIWMQLELQAHVLVEEPPGETPDPEGVFCTGCDGHVIGGVRWPTATNGDDSHQWVERCDTCQQYATDEQAAQRVVEFYDGVPMMIGEDIPRGLASKYVWVEDRTPAADGEG